MSGGKTIKFQQSQALTSHFENLWSIVPICVAYSSVDFTIKVGLLKFEGSRVVLNFGVSVVFDIHGRLFALGLSDTSITIGLSNANFSVSLNCSGLGLAWNRNGYFLTKILFVPFFKIYLKMQGRWRCHRHPWWWRTRPQSPSDQRQEQPLHGLMRQIDLYLCTPPRRWEFLKCNTFITFMNLALEFGVYF